MSPRFLVLLTLFFLWNVSGCSKNIHPESTAEKKSPAQDLAQQPQNNFSDNTNSKNVNSVNTAGNTSLEAAPECDCVAAGDKERADCYKLNPGKMYKNKKGKIVTGRCEPQCIMYARCRSGIMSCRLGDTGPVQWFECARKHKGTSLTPKAGSIMVIAGTKRHKMSTGHLGYVEEACLNADGTWTLRFSHTNYDRKCHLDLDAKVKFDPKTMEADFLSGHWSSWAKKLKICGFILK